MRVLTSIEQKQIGAGDNNKLNNTDIPYENANPSTSEIVAVGLLASIAVFCLYNSYQNSLSASQLMAQLGQT